MKKNLKKVLSLVLALAMVFTMSAAAFAEETTSTSSSVTVVNNLSDHSFNAYQIMAGTYSESADDLTDVTWGTGVDSSALMTALKEVEAYKDCATVEDVEAVLVAATSDDVINAFVEAAYACRTTASASIAAEAKDVELASGYYLIVDSTSNVSGSTTVKAYNNALLQVVGTTVTIAKKTDSPSVEKKVQEIGYSETDSDYVDEYNDVADYSIGDEIGYQLIGTVPDLTYYSYYKYIFTDTISKGLTIDKDSIVVYAADDKSDMTDWVEIDSSTYTVSYSAYEGTNTSDVYYGGSVMKVSFSNIMTASIKDSTTAVAADYDYIIVTYKASLNENAIIGLDGNPNKVKLSYSSNPNATGTGESGSGSESESGSGSESESGSQGESESSSQGESESSSQGESESSSQGESESGSQGESESSSQGESESSSQGESESSSQGESESSSQGESESQSESESESEGSSEPEDDDLEDTPWDEVIVFTYELDVTKVDSADLMKTLTGAEFEMYYVDGNTTYYVQVDSNYKVTDFTTDEAKASTLTSNANGLIAVSGLEDRTYYVKETKAPTGYNLLSNAIALTIAATTSNGQNWTNSVASDALTALTLSVDGGTAVDGDVNSGVVSTTITNTKGTTLPTTGGIGTTIFYIVGAILVIGAAVVLVTRRRVSR